MAMQTEMAYQAPPSPTLTNPDMILPDIDYDRSTSPDDHSNALMMWKNSQIGDMSYSLPPNQYLNMTMGNMGLSVGNMGAAPITPTTPIIYGNGTMLSDIGEVTEAESTVGRNSRPSSPMVPRMTSRAALRASAAEATMSHATYQSIKAKARMMAHERRSSIDSTSTIKTNEHAGLFADFDDSVSVDDSNFQGDDEESVAESYNEELPPPRRRNPLGPRNEEDRLSTVSIGRRAEEILANAKRRLTTMEGNLNRARSSLYITTDESVYSDDSTPSPPLKTSSTLEYQTSPPLTQNHTRMNSDQSLSLDPQAYPRRAASALGAAGGYRHLSNSRSTSDLPKPNTKHNSSDSLQGTVIDDNMSVDSQRNSGQSYLSPNNGHFPDRGLTRSTSAMQMRDIKDQVEGLKGKVSALREQTRADSLKRQSIASLRIPSPFTYSVVEQWYAQKTPTTDCEDNHVDRDGVVTPTGNRSQDRAWSGDVFASGDDDEAMSPIELHRKASIGNVLNETHSHSEYEDAEGMLTPVHRSGTPVGRPDSRALEDMVHHRLQTELDDDMRTEDGYSDGEGGINYDSDSDDSMYHDAEQPLSHEDREDAFDYEHFFLHSAMGTISQQRLERRGSFSSEDSVETTRGPSSSSSIPPMPTTYRRNSTDSVSTTASFETATEGRISKLKRNNSDGSVAGNGSGDSCIAGNGSGDSSGRSRSRSAVRTSGETFVSADDDLERVRPLTARRPATSYRSSAGSDGPVPRSVSSMSSLNTAGMRAAMIRRPVSTSTYQHRPSVSSFDSTGTNRSFPLVNHKNRLSLVLPKNRGRAQSAGIPTPRDSPNAEDGDDELTDLRERLLHSATSIASMNSPLTNGEGRNTDSRIGAATSMGLLHRDDQALVEQLVASFGQCVLKLSEVSRASTDSQVLRSRMVAARRILEGIDEPSTASRGPTPPS